MPGRINDRWDLMLTPDRVEFHAARPLWEAGRLAHMAERVHPGMVVYDVGAECGDFTSLYMDWVQDKTTLRYDSGTVVPFEPKPEMWPSIRTTWEGNGYPPPKAWWPGFAADTDAWDADALEAEFGWPTNLWPFCADGDVRPDPGFRHLRDGNAPHIRLVTFAEVTGLVPDAIVIDVEGAEWNVLAGAAGLLGGVRPLVWVSVHDVGDDSWPGALSGWYSRTADDLDALMARHDYSRTELEGHGEGERFFFYEPR